ncbi:MAG: dTDP-glucose 4,6-dehydratase [Deltaproteobacteria bacterium]|nr:dTDP-glucose 4,6-dehydratase [Deltaproteobacteria bacterium]
MKTTYLVTGGAGFIGANLVHRLLGQPEAQVVVLDLLTYAGNLDSLADIAASERYHFVHGDIGDRELVGRTLERFRPAVVLNLAAESHVDRSIDGPRAFVRTNVVGTFELLDACRELWLRLTPAQREQFRFVHVSTDEVFGSPGDSGCFTEETRYAPNSPYAASKAGADHFVRAYFHTYGLPTITTNCSNNYGPYQFPEKLIPLVTLNALEGKRLPVYGDGRNVRDWLHVDDHCQALILVAERGRPGETYNIGARDERTTLQVVEAVCGALDEQAPAASNPAFARQDRAPVSYRELISFVTDRPGHDRRYAIDPSKIERELGFQPARRFAEGIRGTVAWYLQHRAWCDRIAQGVYRRERLGLGPGGAQP